MKATDIERAAALIQRRKKLREMAKHIGSRAPSVKVGIVIHGDWCGCETGEDIDAAIRIEGRDAGSIIRSGRGRSAISSGSSQ